VGGAGEVVGWRLRDESLAPDENSEGGSIRFQRTITQWVGLGPPRRSGAPARFRGQPAFVHVKGKGAEPLPLVLTHGWPSIFYEMHKVIGPLADPAAHGGDPADAFDVVIPSLPGYGFSDRPRERGLDTALAPPIDESSLTPEQHAWWKEVKAYRSREWGYVHLQSTKLQSLAFGLSDSPVGLAAWIVEKWRRWSDCGGDVESIDTKDELLTNITIYWVTNTIA